jgi:hypothetical protein
MFWLTASAVIALYSKGGGKNGKHAGVPNVTNVASISYAGFQVFQRMHRQLFHLVLPQLGSEPWFELEFFRTCVRFKVRAPVRTERKVQSRVRTAVHVAEPVRTHPNLCKIYLRICEYVSQMVSEQS